MSLINDALKRAKEAQKQGQPSPTPTLQFRPVEAAPHPRRSISWVAPAGVTVITMFALAFLWRWTQNNSSTKTVSSNAQIVATAKEVPSPAPAIVPVVTTPVPVTASTSAAAPGEPTTTSRPAVIETNSPTTPPLVSEPPAPKPPSLKLQAIVYSPTRPSAIIGGKTLFIGEKVGDFRVLAIDRESATIGGRGQTNVLMLEQ